MRAPGARSVVVAPASALLALTCAACTSVPEGRTSVDAVRVTGNAAMSGGDIEDKIATAPTPKFLGLFRGVVYDYAIFDRFVLERDLLRIERFYQARGYYEAEARAARVSPVSDGHVRVEIEVREGLPVRVRGFEVLGLPADIDASAKASARRALGRGAVFDEKAFDDATRALETALGDAGYAYAKVTRDAAVDVHAHVVDVIFGVSAGPKARLGAIRIEGLDGIPREPVLRALDMQEGDPYSQSALASAQQALLDLTVFSAVEIRPVLTDPPPADARVPITVRVEPTKLRMLSLGGGLELDTFKTDVHARVGWEHKNAFGGLEKLNVSLKPGVVLYPTRVPDFQPPRQLLPEEKLNAQIRKPGFLEARTTGFVGGELDVYPAILAYQYDPQQPVIGYIQSKATAGVDRRFGKFFVSLSHVVQVSDPFAYVGALPVNPGTLVVSYPRLFTALDLRNDPIEPHSGFYADNEIQVAGLGGQPRDVRVQPEARGYVPIGSHVTFAVRATVGFLYPINYSVSHGDQDSFNESARDQQIVYFRGFFSGGPASNRGYPLRAVGPQGDVKFLDPNASIKRQQQGCPNGGTSTDPSCQIPLGGVSLWEASAEVRFPIAGPFSGVTFCDASDVSADLADLRFDRPHFSCGLGFRYATPIGPVRFDAGYRIPGLQILGEPDPPVYGTLIPSIPMALQFGIGEAF